MPPDKYGAPEQAWRSIFSDYQQTHDPKLIKRMGHIRAFVEQADREGLGGIIRFETMEEFNPILDEFARRREEIAKAISHGTGGDAMSKPIIKDLLGINPLSRIKPLPMLNDPNPIE